MSQSREIRSLNVSVTLFDINVEKKFEFYWKSYTAFEDLANLFRDLMHTLMISDHSQQSSAELKRQQSPKNNLWRGKNLSTAKTFSPFRL